MKAKVITTTIALALTAIAPAYADGIQSPRGISQSDWHASSTYQNFVCPEGTARGEGVDMNYTTDRSDDYWFVECNPIVIYTPTPVYTTTPFVTPSTSDTPTVTATTTNNTTDTSSTNTTATTVTDTTTAITYTNAQLIALIMELFNKIIALLAQLK